MPRPKHKKPTKSVLLLFSIGFLLFFLSISWHIYQGQILSFNTRPFLSTTQNQQPTPVQILFPKFSIDQPIIESNIKQGVWEINDHGASHLANSANPGEKGNIIIYGHNKLDLFGRALDTQVGDEIKITTIDNKIHTYIVSSIQVVNPTDVSVLSSTNEEVLTFYTCTGFLDSKRFVVKARPA